VSIDLSCDARRRRLPGNVIHKCSFGGGMYAVCARISVHICAVVCARDVRST